MSSSGNLASDYAKMARLHTMFFHRWNNAFSKWGQREIIILPKFSKCYEDTCRSTPVHSDSDAENRNMGMFTHAHLKLRVILNKLIGACVMKKNVRSTHHAGVNFSLHKY